MEKDFFAAESRSEIKALAEAAPRNLPFLSCGPAFAALAGWLAGGHRKGVDICFKSMLY